MSFIKKHYKITSIIILVISLIIILAISLLIIFLRAYVIVTIIKWLGYTLKLECWQYLIIGIAINEICDVTHKINLKLKIWRRNDGTCK